MHRIRRAAAVAAVTAPIVASVTAAAPAQASTIACRAPSLVHAIQSAPSGSTIRLARGCVYVLTAANNGTAGGTGLPVIHKRLTIIGNHATIARSSASGTHPFRLVYVAPTGNLTVRNLTLSHGLANNGVQGGGAIYNHGILLVVRTRFAWNSAPAGRGTSGGAIDNAGRLRVWRSTFTGNSAQEGGGILNQLTTSIVNTTFTGNRADIYGGGALVNAAGTMKVARTTFVRNTGPGGGAIDNDAATTVTDSTFYGNMAGANGGGAVVNFGTITITHSTLSGNSAPYGADVYNFSGHTTSIGSSILAQGMGGGGNCGGQSPVTDLGYNIDTGASCGFSAGAHSMSGTQPRLEALAGNGGPTQTLALPPRSPAINKIPAGAAGCQRSVDQRGVARPQGGSCDIGAYEYVITSGDTRAPSQPQGLTVTGKTSNSVSLRWRRSSDNVGVTRYTIFRNGKAVGHTGGPNVTWFTDVTAAPSTRYTYRIAAYDGSGNHSRWSAGVTVTTPRPPGIRAGQSAAVATASRVTSVTITFPGPVRAGDLLVGWFGQFDAPGQVSVSDNVNGPWTRSSASAKFTGGHGDIAMFYRQDSAAAPWGLTITIKASSPTFLQAVADEFSGIATTGALNQAVAASGTGTVANSGTTPSVGSKELIFSGLMTGAPPGGVTVRGGLVIRAETGGLSADSADRRLITSGRKHVTWTLVHPVDWYATAAVFRRAW